MFVSLQVKGIRVSKARLLRRNTSATAKNQEWKPVSFASRSLTDFESKYTIDELELLAVAWAIEHSKNYMYGIKFQVISGYKSLSSVFGPNCGNKTHSSRLTRLVDSL